MKTLFQHTFKTLVALYCLLAIGSCSNANNKQSQEGLVQSSMQAMRLLKANGKVDKNLIALLELYGLEHDNTPESVNKVMQEKLFRVLGQERRDLEESKEHQQRKPAAMKLYRAMGFLDALPPASDNKVPIDHFLVFGAMIDKVKARFKDFVTQYTQQGLRCKNLVLLGGVRVLIQHEIEKIESELGEQGLQQFLNQLKKTDKQTLTEVDLFRFMWSEYTTDELKAAFEEGKNLFFINSTTITDGTNNPLTTKTTLEAWYETCHPAPGRCHSNVEKPYAMRTEKMLRLFLEKASKGLPKDSPRFSITWNSAPANEHLALPIFDDELAREFCTELALHKFLKE